MTLGELLLVGDTSLEMLSKKAICRGWVGANTELATKRMGEVRQWLVATHLSLPHSL